MHIKRNGNNLTSALKRIVPANFIRYFAVTLFLVILSPVSLAQLDPNKIEIKGAKNSTEQYAGITYGPIDSTDTLWRIAERYRPNNSLSMYQVMVAIYELNQDAFSTSNLNTLKNGVTLNMPSERFIARIDADEARIKSDMDDDAWETRVQELVETQNIKPAVKLINEDELTEAKNEFEERLNEIDTTQRAQFDEIKQQFAQSIDSVQALLDENQKIFDRLDAVSQDISQIQQEFEQEQTAQVQLRQDVDELLVRTAPPVEEEGGPNPVVEFLKSDMFLILVGVLVPLIMAGTVIMLLLRRKSAEPAPSDDLAPPTEIAEDAGADLGLAEEKSSMDELSDSLTDELTDDDWADDDLFGDDDLLQDEFAEELDDSLDDVLESELSEFDELDDDMLVSDGDDDFEASDSDLLEQEDLDDLFAGDVDDEEGIELSDDGDDIDLEADLDAETDIDLDEADLGEPDVDLEDIADDLAEEVEDDEEELLSELDGMDADLEEPEASVDTEKEEQKEAPAANKFVEEMQQNAFDPEEEIGIPDEKVLSESSINKLEENINEQNDKINNLTDQLSNELQNAPDKAPGDPEIAVVGAPEEPEESFGDGSEDVAFGDESEDVAFGDESEALEDLPDIDADISIEPELDTAQSEISEDTGIDDVDLENIEEPEEPIESVQDELADELLAELGIEEVEDAGDSEDLVTDATDSESSAQDDLADELLAELGVDDADDVLAEAAMEEVEPDLSQDDLSDELLEEFAAEDEAAAEQQDALADELLDELTAEIDESEQAQDDLADELLQELESDIAEEEQEPPLISDENSEEEFLGDALINELGASEAELPDADFDVESESMSEESDVTPTDDDIGDSGDLSLEDINIGAESGPTQDPESILDATDIDATDIDATDIDVTEIEPNDAEPIDIDPTLPAESASVDDSLSDLDIESEIDNILDNNEVETPAEPDTSGLELEDISLETVADELSEDSDLELESSEPESIEPDLDDLVNPGLTEDAETPLNEPEVAESETEQLLEPDLDDLVDPNLAGMTDEDISTPSELSLESDDLVEPDSLESISGEDELEVESPEGEEQAASLETDFELEELVEPDSAETEDGPVDEMPQDNEETATELELEDLVEPDFALDDTSDDAHEIDSQLGQDFSGDLDDLAEPDDSSATDSEDVQELEPVESMVSSGVDELIEPDENLSEEETLDEVVAETSEVAEISLEETETLLEPVQVEEDTDSEQTDEAALDSLVEPEVEDAVEPQIDDSAEETALESIADEELTPVDDLAEASPDLSREELPNAESGDDDTADDEVSSAATPVDESTAEESSSDAPSKPALEIDNISNDEYQDLLSALGDDELDNLSESQEIEQVSEQVSEEVAQLDDDEFDEALEAFSEGAEEGIDPLQTTDDERELLGEGLHDDAAKAAFNESPTPDLSLDDSDTLSEPDAEIASEADKTDVGSQEQLEDVPGLGDWLESEEESPESEPTGNDIPVPDLGDWLSEESGSDSKEPNESSIEDELMDIPSFTEEDLLAEAPEPDALDSVDTANLEAALTEPESELSSDNELTVEDPLEDVDLVEPEIETDSLESALELEPESIAQEPELGAQEDETNSAESDSLVSALGLEDETESDLDIQELEEALSETPADNSLDDDLLASDTVESSLSLDTEAESDIEIQDLEDALSDDFSELDISTELSGADNEFERASDGGLDNESDSEATVLDELENTSFDELLSSIDDGVSDPQVDNTAEPVPAFEENPDLDLQALLNDEDDDLLPSDLSDDDLGELDIDSDAELDNEFLDVNALLEESVEAESDPQPEQDLNIDVNLDEFTGVSDDDDVIDVDDDASGLNAKLDLASAYLEIEDTEAAKDLLQEVIDNGTPEQQEEARQLLAKIDNS